MQGNRKGEYNTKQKAQVLSYLEENAARHITAAELVHALTEHGTPVGAATVYRQLERLEAQGLVRRYTLDDRGSACWQYGGAEAKAGTCHSHFHLKCVQCGVLVHLDCDHLAEITAHVKASHGFTIDPARTTCYGVCDACANQTGDAECS